MADQDSAPKLEPGPSGAEVIEYLRRHSDFLVEHPELFALLASSPQYRGERVLDLQSFMLDRLRGDVGRLKTQQQELLSAARSNLSSQSRVHIAVLAMLGATTLEHLIEVVTTDLAVHLEVDAIVLAFEALDRVPRQANATALKLLTRGTIDRLMGGKEIVLLADADADPAVFGGAATLVRSQALLRLQLRRDAPLGVLAFGARTPDKFHPGQATELLTFLGRVVELTIRGWLDRG